MAEKTTSQSASQSLNRGKPGNPISEGRSTKHRRISLSPSPAATRPSSTSASLASPPTLYYPSTTSPKLYDRFSKQNHGAEVRHPSQENPPRYEPRHCHPLTQQNRFGAASLHQRDARSQLFAGYSGDRSARSSPSSVGGGYGYSGGSSTPGGAGASQHLGVAGGGGGYRPATPNRKGQYSDAVLNELESQNDDQVAGILGKVRVLKDVSVSLSLSISLSLFSPDISSMQTLEGRVADARGQNLHR